MTDTFRCGHPRTPENTRWKGNGPGRRDRRCVTCLKASETRRKKRKFPTNFTASWPILDPSMSEDELIAEATADLPNMRPKSHRLAGKTWTVDGNKLTLTAYAYEQPPPVRGERLPAEPILTYAAPRLHMLTSNQRDILNTARRNGHISIASVDQISVRLGTHPGLLWSEWWLDLEETG